MSGALLEAIRADPEDDTPRLVYADWCDDRGEHARAELIRVQLERARLPSWDVRQVGLLAREERLLSAHGAAWRAALPELPGVRWGAFVRGFVGEAVAEFGSLARAARADGVVLVRATTPWPRSAADTEPVDTLRELRLDRALLDPEEAAWLADARALSTLQALEIVDGYSPDPCTERILCSPHLRGLRRLVLERNEVGQQGLKALIAADLPLEALALREDGGDGSWSQWTGGLNRDHLQELADWPGLARIRTLDLSGNRLDTVDFDILLRSPHLTALESFGMGLVLGYPGEVSWTEASPELRLQKLDLSHLSFQEEDAESLSNAPCLRELRHLVLSYVQSEDDGLMRLLQSSLAQSVQILDLSHLDWYTDAIVALRDVSLPSLHTLDLRSVYRLDDMVVQTLAASSFLEDLRSLDLSGNKLGEDSARALAQSPHLGQLERLRIDLAPAALETLRASPLQRAL